MTQLSRPVMIDWQLSRSFGWGVYGINLLLEWASQQSAPLLSNLPIDKAGLCLDPLEAARVRPALEASKELQARLESFRGQHVEIDIPVLHALGNDLHGAAAGLHGETVVGAPRLALPVFESTRFSPAGRERAKTFSLIVAGSSWNRAILDAAGIGPTALALQGVDPTWFHPAPRAGRFGNRFAVFSGGKLEYRKGQDLVVKAFRIFAQRHPEALLVAAWSSPWPEVARSLDVDRAMAPMSFRPDGTIDAARWTAQNGIRPEQFLDLGALPNTVMPRLYREMDVALFPNRAEGATNLVAMECMASGVPTILSANTGHLDLAAPERCYTLTRQSPIAGDDHLGWGESDVAEIVESLEAAWRDRAAAAARGTAAARFMLGRSWAETARQVAELIAAAS